MVLLDEMKGLKSMIVTIPEVLVSAVKERIPELSVVSVYNLAAGVWMQADEDWTDWIIDACEQSFDEREDLWEVICEIISELKEDLESHFLSLVPYDARNLYDVEPLGVGDDRQDVAVIWTLEKE